MSELDEKVKQAMVAFKAGRKQEARETLMAVVNESESHETAWLYLSAMVDTLEEQQICLENVLAINPNNEKARKGLETLKQKQAAQPKTPPDSTPAAFTSPFPSFDAPSAPPSPAKPSGSAPIGAEFAATSGDGLVDGSDWGTTFDQGTGSQSPFASLSDDSMDWLTGSSSVPSASPAAPDQSDPFGIPTSVDWGRSDAPAAYGSGKQVELPSAQEYDDWVQNLNLSNNAPASASPSPGLSEPEESAPSFDANAPAPFGDTSFMMDSSPFVMDDDAAASNAPGSSIFASPWDTEDDAFGSAETSAPDPFAASGGTVPVQETSFPAAEEEEAPASFGFSDEEDSLSFESDDKQPESSGFGNIWNDSFEEVSSPVVAPVRAASGAAPLTSTVTQEDYFRYIPADIEARSGGIAPRSLLLLVGVVALVFLNVVSFAMLLL